jgi:DNA-binding NarL/FixJ family response regulator
MDVLIIDDHPLVREGLERVMAASEMLHVVAEAASIEDALALDVERVDVVTLDLSLPGIGGLEGMGLVRAKWPTAKILVLTVHPETTHAAACAQHGADGFVSKNASPGDIRGAIADVAAGGRHFSAAALEAIDARTAPVVLSPREAEVLRRLAAGQRITDVAVDMGVSVKTASTHKMRLQRKLGANNTAQIVGIARNLGLIS